MTDFFQEKDSSDPNRDQFVPQVSRQNSSLVCFSKRYPAEENASRTTIFQDLKSLGIELTKKGVFNLIDAFLGHIIDLEKIAISKNACPVEVVIDHDHISYTGKTEHQIRSISFRANDNSLLSEVGVSLTRQGKDLCLKVATNGLCQDETWQLFEELLEKLANPTERTLSNFSEDPHTSYSLWKSTDGVGYEIQAQFRQNSLSDTSNLLASDWGDSLGVKNSELSGYEELEEEQNTLSAFANEKFQDFAARVRRYNKDFPITLDFLGEEYTLSDKSEIDDAIKNLEIQILSKPDPILEFSKIAKIHVLTDGKYDLIPLFEQLEIPLSRKEIKALAESISEGRTPAIPDKGQGWSIRSSYSFCLSTDRKGHPLTSDSELRWSTRSIAENLSDILVSQHATHGMLYQQGLGLQTSITFPTNEEDQNLIAANLSKSIVLGQRLDLPLTRENQLLIEPQEINTEYFIIFRSPTCQIIMEVNKLNLLDNE